jgi:hypothetical protein
MPKVADMRESKFLKQSDVGAGALLTVESIDQHNVAKEGADPEMKWCMSFTECEKPLVLNSTNIQLSQNIFGSDDTDDWVGKKIVLYTDPNVSFQGKLVGGIRVRAPKVAAKPATTKPGLKKPMPAPETTRPTEEMLDDSDIPFAWIAPFILPAISLLGAGVLFA